MKRRDRTSGHRSSPFSVDSVPSVIESPNAQTTTVVDGAIMSTASRKYHDVVEKETPRRLRHWCDARAMPAQIRRLQRLACHVIGPLGPAT
jgi:hypothetical protein